MKLLLIICACFILTTKSYESTSPDELKPLIVTSITALRNTFNKISQWRNENIEKRLLCDSTCCCLGLACLCLTNQPCCLATGALATACSAKALVEDVKVITTAPTLRLNPEGTLYVQPKGE